MASPEKKIVQELAPKPVAATLVAQPANKSNGTKVPEVWGCDDNQNRALAALHSKFGHHEDGCCCDYCR